jgi:hypothetical protein
MLVLVTYALLLLVTTTLVSIFGSSPAVASPQPGSEEIHGLPIVALASAGLVCWIVLRSRWSGAKLAFSIALAFLGAHTVLPDLEALAVPGSFSTRAGGVARWIGGAVFAITFATATVVILGRLRRSEIEQAPIHGASVREDAMKIGVSTALQLVLHAAFGCRWGWYPPPEGLALGFLCPSFATLGVVGAASGGALELVRALLWSLIGLALVRLLNRGAIETSLAVGAFFALADPVRQLLPSPLVAGEWASGKQWTLATTQLATGMTLALWLGWRGPRLPTPREDQLHDNRLLQPHASSTSPTASAASSKGLEG